MADRGPATPIPTPTPTLVAGYTPVIGGAGGEPVEPRRFLNVGGVPVPIS